MRNVTTLGNGLDDSLRGVLSVYCAAPARQQLPQDSLNLRQEPVISEPVCRHELSLAILIQAFQVGGNRRVAGVTERTRELGDDSRDTADRLAAFEDFTTLQERSREYSSFKRVLIEDFNEAGGIRRENSGLKILGVVVGRCQHSDIFIAVLPADLSQFEAAIGLEQEQV